MEGWIQWLSEQGDNDWKRVALHVLDGVRVSTVFLGIDHQFGDGPPLVFETMVFIDDPSNPDENYRGDYDMERYSTWDAAILGHIAMCNKVFKPGWKAKALADLVDDEPLNEDDGDRLDEEDHVPVRATDS